MTTEFDRIIGQLTGLPGVVHTKPTTIRSVGMLGIGASQLCVVQTFRQRDEAEPEGQEKRSPSRDWIFFECISDGAPIRVVIPPAVADAIARQRDQLGAKNRSKAAKASAAERMARGERPAFLKGRKGGKS